MKTLYFDCGMGAAGDMLAAALLELVPDGDDILEELNNLGIPKVTLGRERACKCGICGTHFSVKVGETEEGEDSHDHSHMHHHHSGMHEIEHIISHLKLCEKIKKDVMAVYRLIARRSRDGDPFP